MIFILYPQTLIIICFVEKILYNTLMRFRLCIFESDSPVQIFLENDEIFKDLIQTVGLLY